MLHFLTLFFLLTHLRGKTCRALSLRTGDEHFQSEHLLSENGKTALLFSDLKYVASWTRNPDGVLKPWERYNRDFLQRLLEITNLNSSIVASYIFKRLR